MISPPYPANFHTQKTATITPPIAMETIATLRNTPATILPMMSMSTPRDIDTSIAIGSPRPNRSPVFLMESRKPVICGSSA